MVHGNYQRHVKKKRYRHLDQEVEQLVGYLPDSIIEGKYEYI